MNKKLITTGIIFLVLVVLVKVFTRKKRNSIDAEKLFSIIENASGQGIKGDVLIKGQDGKVVSIKKNKNVLFDILFGHE